MDDDVLIIDDKIKEVEKVMLEFSKNRIPVKFFDGDIDNLPAENYFSPRIVFLDIYLDGQTRSDNKNAFSRCISILEAFLSKNIKYTLYIWTSKLNSFEEDENLSEDRFFQELTKRNIKPEDIKILNDKQISIDNAELGVATKEIIEDHTEKIFFIRTRGKILHTAIDLENCLNSWINQTLISDDETKFCEKYLLNQESFSLMDKLKLFNEYYKNKSEESDIKLNRSKITDIRNAFAHQNIAENNAVEINNKEEILTHDKLNEYLDFLNEQKKKICTKLNKN